MAKLTLQDIISGFKGITIQNANNDAIEAAVENTLSRDGSSPNNMNANLDMNSNRILNLPDATNPSEPVTLSQAGALAGVGVPLTQQTIGEQLWPLSSKETTAGLTATDVDEFYQYGDLRRYKVVGNGVTDDTTAFQNALDSNNHIYVPKPSATYRITDTLNVGAQTRIVGESGRPWIKFYGSMTADNLFYVNGNDVHFENLYLEGNKSADTGSTVGCGIYFDDCLRISVKDCFLYNFPKNAIRVGESDTVHILNNRIQSIQANTVSSQSVAGISVEDGTNQWVLENNIISEIGLTDGWGIGIRIIEQNNPLNPPTRGLIINNVVENTQNHGITWYGGPPDAVMGAISNNTVRNTGLASSGGGNALGGGIYIAGVSNIVVSGNFVDYACKNTGSSSLARAGISATAETGNTLTNINITGNVVKNNGYEGIRIQHGVGCAITGNVIDTWGLTGAGNAIGIFLACATNSDGHDGVSVTGNSWTGTTTLPCYAHGNSATGGTSTNVYAEVLAAPYRTDAGTETPYIRNWATGGVTKVKANDIPTTGTWAIGDTLVNFAPSANEASEWVCTVAGAPGTWVRAGDVGLSFFSTILEQDTAYSFALANVGNIIHDDAAGVITYTCDNDSTIPTGASWILINESTTTATIAQGTGVTLRFFDGGGVAPPTGNRTLARAGVATVFKYTNTEFWVWGAGIS